MTANAIICAERKNLKQVFSSGGGTQSTAICALIIQGKLPRPDLIVIADTGYEMPTTWQYLDKVTRPSLDKIGIPVYRSDKKYVSNWAKDIFATSGHLILPAYSNKNNANSKFPGFCSGAWKTEVIERFLRLEHSLTKRQYVTWIGFSCDETNRVLRMQKSWKYKEGLVRFPLVEVDVSRQNAIKVVKEMGWPTPPRSRCYICPNQRDKEWHEVKYDYPEQFEAACKMDESIRLRDENAFLHSTIKPLREVDLSEKENLFSGSCPDGVCYL